MAACEPGKTGKKAGIEPMPIRAYSVAEFCRIFRVSRPSVYKLFASGELHSVVRCRRRLIPVESAEAWWQQESASPMQPSLRNKNRTVRP
jgi:excisionase family DNA binding protein